jgi:urease accessory protein
MTAAGAAARAACAVAPAVGVAHAACATARPAVGVAHATGWQASLALTYALRNGRTTLVEQIHDGPLVVQKPLYPDGDGRCETIVLHPPGGIAGGDRLSIAVGAGSGCELLLTTPGATRWYKANGRCAEQVVTIRARAGSVVEWLPLETIVFDRADARSSLVVDLEGDACVAGWEVTVFGRAAMGERFGSGCFRQALDVRRDGKLLWAERGEVGGADPLFASPVGFAGCSVSGLLWLAGAPAFDARAADGGVDAPGALLRPTAEGIRVGITRLENCIVLARALGNSSEAVKQALARIWAQWRPHYARRALAAPRLWAT